MVLSAMFLAIGGLTLRLQNLVPLVLTFSTIGVIVMVLVVAHFVYQGKSWAFHTGIILALVSILFNLSQPSHINAILHPELTVTFMGLVVSEILGFFLLPAAYIVIYAIGFKTIMKKIKALEKNR